MADTVAETIRSITRKHLEEGNGLLIARQSITRFGKLLGDAWEVKRSLSATITNTVIDQLYDSAISAGAVGGKITGAGGGGFLLIFAEPHHQKNQGKIE